MRKMLAWLVIARVSANGAHDVNGNLLPDLAPEELAVTASGELGDRPATITYWSDLSDEEKATMEPPYVPPPGFQYNTTSGPVEGKINVHLVPHSHDDVGWQVTVDQYFYEEVYYIYDTVVQGLEENPDRKFIPVETGFFARWWDEATDEKKEQTRRATESGQFEFINGAWAMHDEAAPTWDEMVLNTERGHQFLLKNLNATPRGTWQVDPFGHTNTQAWLLGAAAGMPSLFFGRMDWQDREMRYNTSGLEWIWKGSKSLPDYETFTGELYGTGQGGYSTWINFDSSSPQVVDDPELHDYNVDQYVDKFVQDAQDQAAHTLTEHQLWACGTDFNYQNADHWYTNLDKLIHYVNINGTVNAFYSTPTFYTDQKRNLATYEVRQDDIMPLGDDPHNYWSGYFTSRPALKRQVRKATALLQAGRVLEVLANTTLDEVTAASKVVPRPSPRVGDSWTDGLEGAVSLATHHDGMSGTERQDVTDDYAMRISEQAVLTEAGIAVSLAKLLGVNVDLGQCNCNGLDKCLNASLCAFTSNTSQFTVVAFNQLAQARDEVVVVPVAGSGWTCDGAQTQTLDIDDRTKQIPLLYLNKFDMTDDQIAAQEQAMANKADARLAVEITMPALGYSTVACRRLDAAPRVVKRSAKRIAAEDTVVSSDYYSLTFDADTQLLKTIENLKSGVSKAVATTWGWYNSSVGGCTDLSSVANNDTACADQKSGAYIFRPNSSELFGFETSNVTLEVVEGDLITEVRQTFATWATHVFRLYKGQNFIEVEYTAGPIPIDTPWFEPVAYDGSEPLPNNWGKELVMRYDSSIASDATFYSDSNGREMVERVFNKRGPTYPEPYLVSEPVSGNYYPLTQLASIDDGATELAVVLDSSVGGASLASGSLEFMVHRRVQDDDSRGVQEPLNETMCGCNDINAAPGDMGAYGHEGDGGCLCDGLTVRGTHWLVLDTLDNAHAARRQLVERLNFPPQLAFDPASAVPGNISYSALADVLPPNLKLVTLTSNYAAWHGGQLVLRFAHLYEVGEHPEFSAPVQIDLQQVFAKSGLVITAATETLLSANQPKPDSDFEFPNLVVKPMEVKTFLATFETA